MKKFYLFYLLIGFLVHYYIRDYYILKLYDPEYKILPDSAALYILIADGRFDLFGSNSVGAYVLYYLESYNLSIILPFLVTWISIVKLNSTRFTKQVLLIFIASPVASPLFIGVNKELFLLLGSVAYVHYLNSNKVKFLFLAVFYMGMSRYSYIPIFLSAHVFYLIFLKLNLIGRFTIIIFVGYANFLIHSKLNYFLNRNSFDEGGTLQKIFDNINTDFIIAPVSVPVKLISILVSLPYKSIMNFRLLDPTVIYVDVFLTGFGLALISFVLILVLVILKNNFCLKYSTNFLTLLISHSAILLFLPVTQYRYFITLFLFFILLFTEVKREVSEKKYLI